jgi:hypothetical protein
MMNYTGIFSFDLTQILISKKFEKEIVFESSVLAWIRIWIQIRIRIEQKCWTRIRIRNKSIRIHDPDFLNHCGMVFFHEEPARSRMWCPRNTGIQGRSCYLLGYATMLQRSVGHSLPTTLP